MVTGLRSRYSEIWQVLDAVPDPELPSVTITDLGIVREIREERDALVVALTPTYSGCPATVAIEDDVTRALHEHGVKNVRIERRLAPAWTTDWITPRGRARLKEHGIAPPAGDIGNGIVILNAAIRCAHCGSSNTSEISRFGSTPCKALYRCESCREPFDYVKPH
jgi:ring-1,2-phenylacetyl-CoA epoxidase subunit PaaD